MTSCLSEEERVKILLKEDQMKYYKAIMNEIDIFNNNNRDKYLFFDNPIWYPHDLKYIDDPAHFFSHLKIKNEILAYFCFSRINGSFSVYLSFNAEGYFYIRLNLHYFEKGEEKYEDISFYTNKESFVKFLKDFEKVVEEHQCETQKREIKNSKMRELKAKALVLSLEEILKKQKYEYHIVQKVHYFLVNLNLGNGKTASFKVKIKHLHEDLLKVEKMIQNIQEIHEAQLDFKYN